MLVWDANNPKTLRSRRFSDFCESHDKEKREPCWLVFGASLKAQGSHPHWWLNAKFRTPLHFFLQPTSLSAVPYAGTQTLNELIVWIQRS